MIFNYAKLALITGFVAAAGDAGGEYGYRTSSDGPIVVGTESGGKDDFWGRQDDTRNPSLSKKFLKKLKKRAAKAQKKLKKMAKTCDEKDFAKGVVLTMVEALKDKEVETVKIEEIAPMFFALLGKSEDLPETEAFDRGVTFGEKKLGKREGCHKECVGGVLNTECQECCQTIEHLVDWECDSETPAKCCDSDSWTEDCYFERTEDNNQHSCKDCYGYGGYGGYSRGYGGYGGYGYGGYRGRRRAGN